MRPLSYGDGSTIYGHYAVAQQSGALAATLTALDALASVRWAQSAAKFVLHRLKVGVSISGAVTTATQLAFDAIIARGFTVDFTTASTAANLAANGNTGKMRKEMGSSLMGTAGPRIATTTVMSGQTYTLDALPFAITPFPMLAPVTATGNAVALPVGAATPMATLYDWTSLGGHPVTLGLNEGIVVRIVNTGPASGTFLLHTQWEWAEVAASAI